MKANKTLFIALGLASSAMLAQAQSSTDFAASGAAAGQYQNQQQAPQSTAPQGPVPAPASPSGAAAGVPGGYSQQPPAAPTGAASEQQGASSSSGSSQPQPAPAVGGPVQQQSGPPVGSAPQQPGSPAPSASISGNASAPPLAQQPQQQVANGVAFMCGGVGSDEAQLMKSEAPNYDLMLTFAARDGSYLADANVEITDARGTQVFKTTCGAPILLVDLPKSGNYRIRSEIGGQTVSRTAYVQNKKGHSKSLALVWQQQTGTSTGSSSSD